MDAKIGIIRKTMLKNRTHRKQTDAAGMGPGWGDV